MKRTLAIIVILVTGYLMISDGIMNIFDLARCHQYSFNMAAIFVILPFAFWYALGMDKEDGKEGGR